MGKLVVKDSDIVPVDDDFTRRLDIDIVIKNGDRNNKSTYRMTQNISDIRSIVYDYIFGITKGRKSLVVIRAERSRGMTVYCTISECLILTEDEIEELKDAGFTQI